MLKTEIPQASGYSAEIDMRLVCGALGTFELSQTSATFVVATNPRELPVCDAEIILNVDGTEYRRNVTLVNGMTKGARETMILSRDNISPF